MPVRVRNRVQAPGRSAPSSIRRIPAPSAQPATLGRPAEHSRSSSAGRGVPFTAITARPPGRAPVGPQAKTGGSIPAAAGLSGSGVGAGVIQRVETVTNVANAPGDTFDEDAASNFGNLPRDPLGNRKIVYGNVHPPYSTSTSVQTKNLHRQARGTGVGNTRPLAWARFTALIGGTHPFVQGHALSEKLGGRGQRKNLSPFTRSLNGLHRNRAEKQVINHTKKAGNDEYADYDVTMNYGGNPQIAAWSRNRFNNLTLAQKYVGMQAAGLGAGLPVLPAIPGVKLNAARTAITNYVNATFPSSIDCVATFIEGPRNNPTAATAQQRINITNQTP